jgi:hypothetical protein
MSNTPPEIRLLPMNLAAEFPKCQNVQELQQEFFLRELPSKPNGDYLYREGGLRAEPGTVVLFQCKGSVIATAKFTRRQKFEKPDEAGYKGKLYFDVKSIRVFDPVGRDVLREIWEEFNDFSQVMQKLDPAGYPEFEKKLNGVQTPKARGFTLAEGVIKPAGLTISDIAAELNVRSEGRPIGRLQEVRRELHGRARLLNRGLFDSRTIFDRYAFHVGGRTELQFNIGFESIEDEVWFRYGVAFSLKPSRSLPDINKLLPKLARFNEFLRSNPREFSDLRMWHYHAETRSSFYPPAPISPETFRPHVFVFLGALQPVTDNVDYDRVLDLFDSLLPLYRYVEGDASYPSTSPYDGRFRFVPGCTRKPIATTASVSERALDVVLRHNELQFALYNHLAAKYGAEGVGTEQNNGAGTRIDLVVRRDPAYWFYEIKTASSVRGCIREALAQLLEYSFWPGVQGAERLVIVGEARPDAESQAYLARLRKMFSLPIYYQHFDMKARVLVE